MLFSLVNQIGVIKIKKMFSLEDKSFKFDFY